MEVTEGVEILFVEDKEQFILNTMDTDDMVTPRARYQQPWYFFITSMYLHLYHSPWLKGHKIVEFCVQRKWQVWLFNIVYTNILLPVSILYVCSAEISV